MLNRFLLFCSVLGLMLLLSACGPSFTNGLFGENISVNDIPEEASKDELIDQIETDNSTAIEPIIANNFHLLDTVSGGDDTANVYVTKRFDITELVSTITKVLPAEEESELVDNQQVLIYPNHFVTFKRSEEDQQAVLIEVATDKFVRNNYSPNHLNSFFSFMLLNQMLSANNWAETRRDSCSNGNCYGGYSTSRSSNQGGVTSNRGLGSFRGGGPSAGK